MNAQPIQSLNEIVRQSAALNGLLDGKQAASILNVSPGTLSVWRSTGRYSLPFVKVGRSVRYRLSDLESWLDGRTRINGTTA